MYKLVFVFLLAAAAHSVTYCKNRNGGGARHNPSYPSNAASATSHDKGQRRHRVEAVTSTPERMNTSRGLRATDVERKARKAAPSWITREDALWHPHAALKGKMEDRHVMRTGTGVIFPSGEVLRVVRGADGKGQEHYDPNRSGNPLLDTGGVNRSKMLSDNFSVSEYAQSGGQPFNVARIDPQHVICLQNIRDFVGKPVRIDSGYRSFKYNQKLYRKMHKRPTDSQHISGRAADIKIEGMNGTNIAQAAIAACGDNVAVGLGSNYAHIDTRGLFRIWKYSGVSNQQVAEVRRYRAAKLVALNRRARRIRSVSLLKRG